MDDKTKGQKCRVIGLDELNIHPLTPGMKLDKRDLMKLMKKMEEWFSKTNEEIDTEFNSIVNDKILYHAKDIEEIPIENNQIYYSEKSV